MHTLSCISYVLRRETDEAPRFSRIISCRSIASTCSGSRSPFRASRIYLMIFFRLSTLSSLFCLNFVSIVVALVREFSFFVAIFFSNL